MTLRRSSVNLAELPDGRWLNREVGRYYATAHGALRAVKRAAPVNSLVSVSWHPISPAGTALVKALLAP